MNKETNYLKAEEFQMSAAATRARKFAGTPMTALFSVEETAPSTAIAPEEARGFMAPGDTEFTYFDYC